MISWTEFVEHMQKHSCPHCPNGHEHPKMCIEECMNCFADYIKDTVKRYGEMDNEKGGIAK